MAGVSTWRRYYARRELAALRAVVRETSNNELAGAWKELEPLEKLAVHKLLPEGRTLEVFGLLDFEERFFLYCGLDRMALAPLLEGLDDSVAGLIREFSAGEKREMLESLQK